MTKDDKQTMDAYGIKCESTVVYYYKEFKYERLVEAVRFAELDAERIRLKDGTS